MRKNNIMNINFRKKNVFISGATHGIGLACLLAFAKLGANVFTFSRDRKKILDTKKKLKFLKSRFVIEEGDILDEDFIHDFSKSVLKKYNRIDVLVHNVGGGGRWGHDNFLDTELNVWEDVYYKNNKGLIIFSKYFIPAMIKNNWGRIIAIGSICGVEARKEDRSWFNAAKSAQHAIIKSFSKKHIFTKKNITFNSISPGPIFIKNTGWDEKKIKNPKKFKSMINNLVPTKHLGIPQDVSNLCMFLCSDYAKYINGANIIIDGGTTNVI
jgi:NAD(P)-dependent dehydrogenase (short-subunit alcohol dehydrogenase family)